MGTQFWWFYDAAVAAILLVAIFVTARKPAAKAFSSLIAYALGLFVALSSSGSVASAIYKSAVRISNVDKIEHALDETDFLLRTKSYIESLGYNVAINEETLTEILSERETDTVYVDVYEALYSYINNINGRVVDKEEIFREKMAEGFAGIIRGVVDHNLTAYAAEVTAEAIKNDPASMEELIILIQSEKTNEAAKYIEDNYTAPAYHDIISLICSIIIMFIVVAVVKFFTHALLSGNNYDRSVSIGEHITGALLGLLIGAAIVVVAAIVVRIYTIFGSGEMLFFNNDVIDKTIVFKYFFKLVSKL